jgi:hypothetical protein
MEIGPKRQARSLKRSLLNLSTMFQWQQPVEHKKVVNLVTSEGKNKTILNPRIFPVKGPTT